MKNIVPSTDKGVLLFRVQAADGRGPWRPGFSKIWIDNDSAQRLPDAVQDAFGMEVFQRIPRGWHAGCACRSIEKLLAWFTPVEQRRLEAMGYSPVTIRADKIIAENADQVVFARRKKLHDGALPLAWTIEVAA